MRKPTKEEQACTLVAICIEALSRSANYLRSAKRVSGVSGKYSLEVQRVINIHGLFKKPIITEDPDGIEASFYKFENALNTALNTARVNNLSHCHLLKRAYAMKNLAKKSWLRVNNIWNELGAEYVERNQI